MPVRGTAELREQLIRVLTRNQARHATGQVLGIDLGSNTK